MNEQSRQTGAQHAIFVNMGFMTVIPLEFYYSYLTDREHN